jgi:flagellar secretion chaperone FliS
MISTAYATNAYRQTKLISTEDPLDLIIMLYDGAVESLDKAARAADSKDLATKLRSVDKAGLIIDELMASLNKEIGGDITANLEDLYLYMSKELTLANLQNDSGKMRQVRDLAAVLRSAWIAVRDQQTNSEDG